MQLAHLDPQRVHVGIGRAELAERLVDAEDGVLGERDARRMRGATSSCSSASVSWMRAANRVGPRQAASREGFVTAVRPLRTVTASTVLTENETWTSSRSPEGPVRVGSSVTGAKRARSLRATIAIPVLAAIFPRPCRHGSL